jgi:hypothetical protein
MQPTKDGKLRILVNAGKEGVKRYLKWHESASGGKEVARIYKNMAAD